MPSFQERRQRRLNNDNTSRISWPLQSSRNSTESSAQHNIAYPTSPKISPRSFSLDQESIITGSSWYGDDISSPELSRESTRRESDTSECSTCDGRCMEQTWVSPGKLPSQKNLDLAGEVEIFDGNGTPRPFKSLYQGSDAMGDQQLIIFVRHFLCFACQEYLKVLSQTINVRTYFSLPVPTSITIIGLGDPKFIPSYRSFTGTKFPIFTDPSRQLHRLLGMTWTMNYGRRPEYWEKGTTLNGPSTIIKQIRTLPEDSKIDQFKAGGVLWVGGEFLIKDGKVVWCRRMKNVRDHTAMSVIKELLGIKSA